MKAVGRLKQQTEQLEKLIADAQENGAKVIVVNPASEKVTKKLAPHIVTNVKNEMLVMQEEIV